MSRKSTPVMGMSILLVLILAIAGVAFTQWTGSVLVDGSATTLGVKVWWNENESMGCPATDVSFISPTEVQLTRADAVQGDTDTCSFVYENIGTIPVVVKEIKKDGEIPGQLELDYVDGVGSVMNPCPALDCKKTIQFTYTIGDDALPFHTYNFSLEIVTEQQ